MGSPNFLHFKVMEVKCNVMFDRLERANFCNQRAITLCNIDKKERVELQLSTVPKIRRFTPAIIIQISRGIGFKFSRSVQKKSTQLQTPHLS